MAMPEYTDGVLELLRIEEDCSQDFPVEKVRSTGMHIWYRELSVFDTTRAKLSADGIEVTMKISIPQYKQVNSKCICVIDGAQHEIYNVAHVTTKDGFKETEGMCTLTVNGNTMTANVGQNLTIDTDRMIAYRSDGTLNNTQVTGNYEDMYLLNGENEISFSGGELKVIPNWRCL